MFHPSSLVGKHIDQFRLDEFIAKGAMGMVFKAFDTVLFRTVAIKLISKHAGDDLTDEETTIREEARKRLIQEAKAAGRLNHPNILTIYSYGETEDFEYICMEYLTGKTLIKLLSEKKVIDAETAINILDQVLRALDAANKEQIVHRDIKPSNIMITEDGRVKVMDFGIAKLPSFSMTTVGTVLGTPYYMSPEQISGQKVDIRSDIFSVGAVLYQILTGERPFDATNTATLAYKIVQVDPINPEVLNVHVPYPLGKIIKRALDKNPDERYQTPAEMLDDLNQVRTGKRSLGYEDLTIVRRDEGDVRNILSSAMDSGMTVRADSGNAAGQDMIADTPQSQVPRGRLVEFPRSPVSNRKTGSSRAAEWNRDPLTSVPDPDTQDARSNEEEIDEDATLFEDPAAWGGPQSSKALAEVAPHERVQGFDTRRRFNPLRLMGFAVVLLLVVTFWYVAHHAFREIRAGLPTAGDSNTAKRSAKEPPPVAASPEVKKAQAPPPTSSDPAVAPVQMGPQPTAEQLIVEAKNLWSSDPAAARKLLEKAVALYPNHFDASFQLSRIMTYQMDYVAAIRQYEKTMQINSQNPEVYFNLGYICLTQGDYDAAIRYLEACLALKPPFLDEVLSNLGICYLKKNVPDRAADYFKQALEANPGNVVAKGYISTLGQNGNGGAAAGIQADLTKTPESVAPAEQLVAQAKEKWETDPDEAQKILEKAVSEYPQNFEAVFQLARLLTFQKDYPGAIEMYQRALRLNGDSADAHFNLGYIFLVSKDYDKALNHYESCLALDPPYRDEVLTNMALSYLKKNDTARARKMLREALLVNPSNDVASGYLQSLDKKKKGAASAEDQDSLATSGTDGASSVRRASSRGLEGDYTVDGKNPSGSTYRGKARVVKSGKGYKITWTMADRTFSGNGSLKSGVLAVNWRTANGAAGVMDYTIGTDGTLRGSWADGAGTEILIPANP